MKNLTTMASLEPNETAQILELAARAQAAGIDPDQALRDAVRALEARITGAESAHSNNPRP